MYYNPFRNILLVMSLSGSVIMLSYILIYPIAKRHFSLACRYWILKIALAFYLIPFSQCSSRMRSIIFDMFPNLIGRFGVPLDYINTKYAVFTEGNSIYVSTEVKESLILVFGFGILSCMVILFYIFRYRNAKKICIEYSNINVENEIQELFQGIKNKLAIKRNVKLLCSEYCKSPVTMGIVSPVIIIPLWKEESVVETCQNVITHELVHIKHYDILFKFLGIVVIAIHWFNPLAYFLYYEISNISEMYCDSIVLEGKGEKERKAYGELLLKLAAESSSVHKTLSVGIAGSSKKAFKRRIIELKTDRKNKTVVSVLALILICITGGTTIFAYDMPQTISYPEDMGGASRESEICFYAEGELQIEIEEIPYDYFFTDESGNIYDLTGEEAAPQASSSHQYVSGSTTSHNKNSSGGCTVTYYEALKCSKCGHVKTVGEISTTTYKKCPH